MSFQATEQERRLANIAQLGVVEDVAYDTPPRARVRIGALLTGWLRMGARRAGDAVESWSYSPGEEVLVIATSGDLSQGVIVCALANQMTPATAGAGIYRTSYPGGVVIEIAGGAVNITAPADVNVNGDVIAGKISLKTHVHEDVVPGTMDSGGPK